MKALTLSSDWAMEVLCGNKVIECRTWETSYRGELIICGNAKRFKGCIPGHALLVCTLKDIVPFKKEHLEGAYMECMPDVKSFAWILDDFKPIVPVAVKGKLGLYDLDISLEYILDAATDDEIEIIYGKLIA